MKMLFLATNLLVSCVFISCSQEIDKSERERQKGYKELKVYSYDYNFDSGELDTNSKELEEEYTYDKEGNIATKKYFLKDNSYTKQVYKYNNKGFLIELQVFDIFDNNIEDEKLTMIIKYKYNDKGLLIEKAYYNKHGEPISKHIYEYN